MLRILASWTACCCSRIVLLVLSFLKIAQAARALRTGRRGSLVVITTMPPGPGGPMPLRMARRNGADAHHAGTAPASSTGFLHGAAHAAGGAIPCKK